MCQLVVVYGMMVVVVVCRVVVVVVVCRVVVVMTEYVCNGRCVFYRQP